MDFVKELEEILTKRNNQLFWNCERVYFMSDLYYYNDEDEQVILPSDADYHYWLMDHIDEDSFHYNLKDRLYGLAEYLHKDYDGFDKNEVPLIQYEITNENKLLITCFVEKEFLKEHPDTIKKLEDYIDGQISDGWGENGFTVKNFLDDIKEVWADGVKRVKKRMSLDSTDHVFEDFDK